MPTRTVEERWLGRFGAALYDAVKRSANTPELHPRRSLVVTEADNSGGWAVHFADLSLGRGTVAVHAIVDQFSGHTKRTPWVGAFLPNERTAMATYNHLRRHGLQPVLVRPSQMTVTDGDVSRLRTPLPHSHFGRPVVELYDGEIEQGLGVYIVPPRSYHNHPSEAMVSASMRFLREVVASVVAGKPPRTPTNAPASLALRRAVISLKVVARSSRQAAAAKARDGYTCGVCGFRPEDMYGIEGRSCLEAHHVEAVAAQAKVLSKLDRIITLCSNCHRVVHRLPNSDRQLNRLRRRFRGRR